MSPGRKVRKSSTGLVCTVSVTYEKVFIDARETHTLALKSRWSNHLSSMIEVFRNIGVVLEQLELQ